MSLPFHVSLIWVLLLLCLLTTSTTALSTPRHPRSRSSSPSPSSPPLPPRRSWGVNRLAAPDVDCPLKAFAVQFAAYIQPPHPVVGNWSRTVVDAMGLAKLCNLTADDVPPPPFTRPSTVPARSSLSVPCQFEKYVDGLRGNNSAAGTLAQPWREVVYALSQSRLRPVGTTACIYIRGGWHWFGDHQESFGKKYESQVGALSLQAMDSGLTLAAYNAEEVVFSGGVDLTSSLKWSAYRKVQAGTIMMAKLPDSVDVAWDHFNELYVDGFAAVRAKYPNGLQHTHHTAAPLPLHSDPTPSLTVFGS